jgi:hypothetical protein
MLADIGQYLWDLADNWAAFLTGGIPVAVLVVWERWRSKQSNFRFFVAIFLVFGFVAANFQTWRQEHAARSNAEHAADYRVLLANRWEPLTTDEALAFKRELKKMVKVKTEVLCNFAGCSDIALSFQVALEESNWDAELGPGFGSTISGVQVWSGNSQAQQFANAVELATKGRIKPKLGTKGEADSPLADDLILFVIGRKR